MLQTASKSSDQATDLVV